MEMLKKFRTNQLVFIALMAALMLAINFSFGGLIIALTGIPLFNGIVTGVVCGIFLMIMYKTLPKFGTFTLFLLIYAVLELPTTLGGAPGFWPKIPINVISGLAGDILFLAFRYKKASIYPIFYVLITVNTLVFIWFMKLLGVAGWDKILSILWWFLPLYFVLGTIGIFIGELVIRKLKNKNFYIQIRS
jgi:hypothetical protein